MSLSIIWLPPAEQDLSGIAQTIAADQRNIHV
jgi:hypothetical protein